MAKPTRRTSRIPTQEESKDKSTVSDKPSNGPRIKKIAEPKLTKELSNTDAEIAEVKLAAKFVELVEGATYTVRGTTFVKNRPVVITDPRLLASVEVNSRFKVMCA